MLLSVVVPILSTCHSSYLVVVFRIKCKLGYAELHKPAPGFGPGETVR